MPSNYPAGLDELTDGVGQPTDPLQTGHVGHHAAVGEAVEAVQTELGLDPAGAAATVRARLDTLDTAVAGRLPLSGGTLTGTVTTTSIIRRDDKALYDWTGSPYLAIRKTGINPASQNFAQRLFYEGRGTATVSDRFTALQVQVRDDTSVANRTITGAANSGSGLIRITAAAHGWATGDKIAIVGVGGTTEANGAWTITVVDANTFDLQSSTFTNAYTSGGTATNRPMLYGVASTVIPTVARGGLAGTAANADDVNCFIGYNGGTSKATDAYYLGRNPAIAGSEWITMFTSDANGDYGIRLNGTIAQVGLDFSAGTFTAGTTVRFPTGKIGTDGTLTVGATSPSFYAASRGVYIGSSASSATLETTMRAFGNSSSVFFEAMGTTSGATQVRGRFGAAAGGAVNINAVSNHPLQFLQNNTARFTLNTTGNISIADAVNVEVGSTTGTTIGTSASQKLGFFNSTPVVQPTVTGSRGGNAAVASLLTQLAALGLIVDSTSA